MLRARKQLQECTRYTKPIGYLTTPALQLRCKAVKATAKQLRKLRVGELYTEA